MVAAKYLFPGAKLVFSGNLNENVQEVYNLFKNYITIFRASEIESQKINKIVVVDTDNIRKLGKFSERAENREVELIVYDHHYENRTTIKRAAETYILKKEKLGANTTFLLKEILKNSPEIEFKPYEIELFMMGIYEDTGNLTYTNTTADDIRMAAYLLDKGANLELVNSFVSKSLTQQQRDIFLEYMRNGTIIDSYGEKIFLGNIFKSEFIDGLDVVTNKIKDVYGVDAIFIVFGDSERVYVIGRSSSQNIKVNEIMGKFGGGGHYNAGSAVVKGSSCSEIREQVAELLTKREISSKKAKDIMQFPVKTVREETVVKEAYKILLRFGYSSLPVINGRESICGIISRRDIDRAIMHGFVNAPVKVYMNSSFYISEIDTPIEKLKEILITNDIGSIPIVDLNRELRGIVTRGDVLRGIYEQKYGSRKIQTIREENIKKQLKKSFSSEVEEIFEEIKKVSKKRGERVFLVGGIVRDILLGIKNLDIDIVVEGAGTEFAKELGDELKAKKVIIHDKFHTAVVKLANGLKIDVATSRVEYYEYPTSMPVVEKGSIKQDLYRRDFTINAMAIEIDYESFGKLIDIFNGHKDLKEKRIKILHNFSFIEDPTRIIRAIRFAVRYGFEIEKDSERLIEDAVESGFLHKLSLKRVRNELEIIFQEKNAERAVEILDRYKIFTALSRKINLTEHTYKILNKIREYGDLIELLSIKKWLLYFLIILEALDREEMIKVFNELSFKMEFIEKYSYGRGSRSEIVKKLEKAVTKYEIFTILNKISFEILIQILLTEESSKVNEKIIYFIKELRNTKGIIAGRDLIEYGFKAGKEFSMILEKLFEYQINNSIKTKEDMTAELIRLKKTFIPGDEKSD